MFKTLRSRILTSYLVLVLVMGGLTAWSVATLIKIENRGREVVQDNLGVLTLLDTMEVAAGLVKTNSLRLVYDPNDSVDIRAYSLQDEALTRYIGELKTRVSLHENSATTLRRIDRLNYLLTVLRGEVRSLVMPQANGYFVPLGERAEAYNSEIEPIFDSVRSVMRLVGHGYMQALGQSSLDMVEDSEQIRFEVLAWGLAATALCVWLSLKFSKSIVGPIVELTEKSRLITAGELHQMVIPRTNDELGRLGEQFNLMAEKLSEFEELNLKKILEEKAISESIVQAMEDGLILIDRLGFILSVNRKAQELFSFREAEGQRCAEVARGIPVLESLCRAATTNSWHSDLTTKVMEHGVDGQRVYLTRDVIPIQSGEWLGTVAFLLILRDVTRAYELEKMRSDFVGMVSHELRTPLTSIRMSVDLLAEPSLGQLSAVQGQFVQAIREESERLLRIVNDLMDLAKIESGKFEVKPHEVELQEFLDHLLVPFVAPARESQIDIRLEPDPEIPTVLADPDRLTQVFVNLISNAMRYTPSGGSITVGVRPAKEGALAEFYVRDTGAGIPPEFLPKVFQRFAIESSDAKAGTGLGLAIAREIVQAHGGTISVNSEINKGTEFVFTIPLAASAQIAQTRINTLV